MRVSPVNFKGLILFNNISINPKEVSKVLAHKLNDRFDRRFYIKMSDGKTYYYSANTPTGKVPDFSDLVSKYMHNNKTCKIDADLKPITCKNKQINGFF